MDKKSERTAEECRENKLNNASTLFMRLAVVSLLLMLMLIFVSGITPSVWMLFWIAIIFLVLGLICGISYLKSAFPMQRTEENNG